MEPSRDDHYATSSSSKAPDLLPTKMDVDLVINSATGRGNSSSNGVACSRNVDDGEQDNVDIVIPPSTYSSRQLQQQQQQPTTSNSAVEHSDTMSEPDSKNFFSSGLFKRLTSGTGSVSGPIAPAGINDLAYKMDHPCRGRCVVFNHCTFDKSQQLPDRSGTGIDVEVIKSVFSQLGFTFSLFTDYTFDQLVKIVYQLSQEDHSQNDCLAIFVLSHGVSSTEVYAFDITYKVSTIWDMFTAEKCSTLAGKPKMFFIQACRGFQYDAGTQLVSRTEVDGPGKESYRIPNQADFLTVFSTYEASNGFDFVKHALQYMSFSAGYYSWRNSKNGSCFIQALCKIFSQWNHCKDVLSMLTIVNREVAINYESRSRNPGENRKKQVPHVCHTLMRDIIFSPKPRSTLV